MSKQNIASIFIYKSMRKNSKLEMFNLYQWEGAGTNGTVPYNLVSIIERVLIQSKEYGTSIVKSYSTVYRDVMVKNADSKFIMIQQPISYNSAQVQFYSCENIINWVYNIWMQVHPDATLSLDDVYKNASISYFISRFYSDDAKEVQ